jgi:hypothetical protein
MSIKVFCSDRAYVELRRNHKSEGLEFVKIKWLDSSEKVFVNLHDVPVIGILAYGASDSSQLKAKLSGIPLNDSLQDFKIYDAANWQTEDLRRWAFDCLERCITQYNAIMLLREKELVRARIAHEELDLRVRSYQKISWSDLKDEVKVPLLEFDCADDQSCVDIDHIGITQGLPPLPAGLIAIQFFLSGESIEPSDATASLFLPNADEIISLDGPYCIADNSSIIFNLRYALSDSLCGSSIILKSQNAEKVVRLRKTKPLPPGMVEIKHIANDKVEKGLLAAKIYHAPIKMAFGQQSIENLRAFAGSDKRLPWRELKNISILSSHKESQSDTLLAFDEIKRSVIIHPQPHRPTLARFQTVTINPRMYGRINISFALVHEKAKPVEMGFTVIQLPQSNQNIINQIQNWTALEPLQTANVVYDIPLSDLQTDYLSIVVASKMMSSNDTSFAWAAVTSVALSKRNT